jgi:hypothetical protein
VWGTYCSPTHKNTVDYNSNPQCFFSFFLLTFPFFFSFFYKIIFFFNFLIFSFIFFSKLFLLILPFKYWPGLNFYFVIFFKILWIAAIFFHLVFLFYFFIFQKYICCFFLMLSWLRIWFCNFFLWNIIDCYSVSLHGFFPSKIIFILFYFLILSWLKITVTICEESTITFLKITVSCYSVFSHMVFL